MSRNQENKEKLLEVAASLFASRGFRGTSIRDIAREMDMSISNIYHYFGNKEGLLLEILKHASIRLTERLRRVEEKDMEPLERFRLLVHTHLCISMEYAHSAKIFFMDDEQLTPEGCEFNSKIQRDIFNIYKTQIRLLYDAGYIRSQNTTIVAFNIIALINWHLRWFRPDGKLTLEETIYEIIHFILYGILVRKDDKQKINH